MKRQTLLLLVVAILLLVKFGLVPLWDKIEENNAIISALENRVSKGNALIATEEVLRGQENQLDQFLGDSKANFPVVEAPEITQLQFQRIIRTKADEFGITIESQEWTKYEDGTPAAAYLKIRVLGSLENYPGFLLAMENVGAWVSLDELNLDVNKQRLNHMRLGMTNGRLVFRISYILEESNGDV